MTKAHGYFVYESTLRVPLIFRGPRIAPGVRVAPTVRAVDVLPTLLELMDLPRSQDSARNGPAAASPPRSTAALRRGSGRICRIADAAASLRMERPPLDSRRTVEIFSPRARSSTTSSVTRPSG